MPSVSLYYNKIKGIIDLNLTNAAKFKEKLEDAAFLLGL
jgi:hypothetical protein